ncbi:MAG: ribosome assembly RNA-binding protein YhbY [Calditrichia bacterium]|nr:ribosome assembly RNA-binding protein YhbY [Calditrichia bacterium]
MTLSGKEKRNLRATGNRLKPEVWIGKEGVSEGTSQTLLNSFHTKELVKVKILENCEVDKKTVAQQLEKLIDAEIIQIIGNTILLYKPLPAESL